MPPPRVEALAIRDSVVFGETSRFFSRPPLGLGQQPLHPVPVRMPADRLLPPGCRDRLALAAVGEVVRDDFEHLARLAIRRQVHAIVNELVLPVFSQVVGDQQRPTRQRLEDPHIHIIAEAAVEDDPAGRVDPRHLVEERPADDVPGELAGDRLQQLIPRPGEDMSDERDVVLFGDLVLAMDARVARQRQPGGRLDAGVS